MFLRASISRLRAIRKWLDPYLGCIVRVIDPERQIITTMRQYYETEANGYALQPRKLVFLLAGNFSDVLACILTVAAR
jgi:hypothetical protein